MTTLRFSRSPQPPPGFVEIRHQGRPLWVMQDFYTRDSVRMPMGMTEAERVRLDLSRQYGIPLAFPTKEQVDSIHVAADVHLVMPTQPAGPDMASSPAIQRHNDQIERALAGRTGLISGHKKEIIRPERAGRVTIYGGLKQDGTFWQSRPSSVHYAEYFDYSHGLRFVYDPGEGENTMAKYNDAILAAAGEYLGLEEWPGARHNPAILKMWTDIGITGSYFEKDETPWCAAFANAILAQLGLPHTGSGMAKSFDTYGTEVQLKDILPGDLIRFWRGSPSSDAGHIAIFVRFGSGNTVVVRGGNQGNRVSDAEYPISRIVSIRRADGVTATGNRPVLREGDRGAFVLDLQNQLVTLGYTLGTQDGVFGSRTLAAVVAFQADNDLVADGVVGPNTWGALAAGEQRMERNIEEEDLKGRSRTYDTAASGKNVATVGGAVATASVALSEAQNAVGVAQEAEGLLERVGALAPSILAVLAIAVVAYFAWQHFDKIRAIRVEDAKTGRNDGV